VSENRVLRRIFQPKRNEIIGDLRNLHNDEFHSLHSSPNISRRTRLAEYVTRMGANRNAYRFCWQSQNERVQYEDLDVGGRAML
jgi:hypothetical protein